MPDYTNYRELIDVEADPDHDPTPWHQWEVTQGRSATERDAASRQRVLDIESGAL